jgi:hypothetical protein
VGGGSTRRPRLLAESLLTFILLLPEEGIQRDERREGEEKRREDKRRVMREVTATASMEASDGEV